MLTVDPGRRAARLEEVLQLVEAAAPVEDPTRTLYESPLVVRSSEAAAQASVTCPAPAGDVSVDGAVGGAFAAVSVLR